MLQKHFHGDIFVQWRVPIIVRESLSSKASEVCQTALGTSLYHFLQSTGTRNFNSAELHLKTVAIAAVATWFERMAKCVHAEGS